MVHTVHLMASGATSIQELIAFVSGMTGRLSLAVLLIVSVACGSKTRPQSVDSNNAATADTTGANAFTLDPASLDSTTLNELIAARHAVWRAYFEGDSASLVQLLPDTMFAMGQDRATIIRDAKSFVTHGGKFVNITFRDNNVFVRDDVAVVNSRYQVNLTQNGQSAPMSGVAIELFERKGGRWINPSWHLDDEARR